MTLNNPKAARLQEALQTDGVTVTVTEAGGDGSDLDTGSYTVKSGQTLVIQSGTFTPGALTIMDGGSFINSGTFTVIQKGLFSCMGTYTENRDDQLYIMARNDDGSVYWLAPAGEMPTWYASTTVTLLGAKAGTIKFLPPVTVPDVTLDLNGRQVTLTSPLSVSADTAAGELTITDSSQSGSGSLQYSDTTVQVTGGTLALERGTVISTGGTAILASSGTVKVSGGTVYGYSYGIQNTSQATVSIFGNAVIMAAGDQALPVSGTATFGNTDGNNVVLKAKDPSILFKMFNGATSGPDTDGYYSVTGPIPAGP